MTATQTSAVFRPGRHPGVTDWNRRRPRQLLRTEIRVQMSTTRDGAAVLANLDQDDDHDARMIEAPITITLKALATTSAQKAACDVSPSRTTDHRGARQTCTTISSHKAVKRRATALRRVARGRDIATTKATPSHTSVGCQDTRPRQFLSAVTTVDGSEHPMTPNIGKITKKKADGYRTSDSVGRDQGRNHHRCQSGAPEPTAGEPVAAAPRSSIAQLGQLPSRGNNAIATPKTPTATSIPRTRFR